MINENENEMKINNAEDASVDNAPNEEKAPESDPTVEDKLPDDAVSVEEALQDSLEKEESPARTDTVENEISAEDTPEENGTDVSEEAKKETYAFRWSYSDQYINDRAENESAQKKKKGAKLKHIGVYVSIMVIAFSFVFAVLALSLKFDDMSEWFADDPSQELTVTQIVDKGMPSAVSIYALKSNDSYSAGSGFVISNYGYVVTNYHVVENAVSVAVVDSKGHEYSASVIGYNADNDVAVIYIDNCSLPAVTLGDSSALVLGETLVAIGTPGGEECAFSVSNGIVSGLNRQVTGKNIGMIQTNAPLNPGNSGGPLFDSKGNLIGIVTMKYTFTSVNDGGQYLPYEGISFALPINAVISEIQSVIEKDLASPKIGVTAVPVEGGKDYFYYDDRGAIFPRVTVDGAEYYLDSSGKSHIITDQMKKDSGNMLLSADATGILIVGVTKGLGAYGKLEKGDIVTSVNGVTVATVADFAEVCLNLGVGQKISVTFIRDGEACSDTITLMKKLDMINAS